MPGSAGPCYYCWYAFPVLVSLMIASSTKEQHNFDVVDTHNGYRTVKTGLSGGKKLKEGNLIEVNLRQISGINKKVRLTDINQKQLIESLQVKVLGKKPWVMKQTEPAKLEVN